MKSATYTLIAFATLSCAYDLAIPAYNTIRFWVRSPWQRIQSTMKHLTGYWFGRFNLGHSTCAPNVPSCGLSSRQLNVIKNASSSMQQSVASNANDIPHTRHIASDLAKHVHFAECGSVHHKIRVISSRFEQNIAVTIAQYLSDHCSELMYVKPNILRAQLMPCIQLSLINEVLISEQGDFLPGYLSQEEQESVLCFRSYFLGRHDGYIASLQAWGAAMQGLSPKHIDCVRKVVQQQAEMVWQHMHVHITAWLKDIVQEQSVNTRAGSQRKCQSVTIF